MRSPVRTQVHNSPARHLPVILSVILLAAGAIVSAWIAYLQYGASNARERQWVSAQLNRVRSALSVELQSSIYLTQGIVSVIELQGSINRSQFDSLAHDLISHKAGIRDIGVAPDNVVSLVYPLAGNEKAIGLDYRSIPDQWAAVRRAMLERRTVVAGPVQLIQGGVGITTRTPVFIDRDRGAAATYWGMVSAVFDLPSLIDTAGLDRTEEFLQVALRGTDGLGAKGAVFWGEPGVFSDDPVLLEVVLSSGNWQLAAVPRSGWVPFSLFTSPYFYAGLALSLVLSLLLLQLLLANRALRVEIGERQKAELVARESALYSRNLIDASIDPFMVVDRNGVVQDVNRAMERISGRPREELVGSQFPSIFTDPDLARIGIERVWSESSLRDFPLEIGTSSGRQIHVRCNASLYREGAGRARGVFVVARDDTDQLRAAEQLEASVREKDVLLREIHHRVKNNLQVVVSLLSLQSSRIRDPYDAEIFGTSRNRVLAMALVHEVLYQNENLASIRMEDYVPRLINSLRRTYGLALSNVRIVTEVDPVELDVERALPCALIINELVSNSLKHAFDPATGGTVSIGLSLDQDGTCVLEVKDDGKGFAADVRKEASPSFGLMMVEVLTTQIHGKIDTKSTAEGEVCGTRTRLLFPMDQS